MGVNELLARLSGLSMYFVQLDLFSLNLGGRWVVTDWVLTTVLGDVWDSFRTAFRTEIKIQKFHK